MCAFLHVVCPTRLPVVHTHRQAFHNISKTVVRWLAADDDDDDDGDAPRSCGSLTARLPGLHVHEATPHQQLIGGRSRRRRRSDFCTCVVFFLPFPYLHVRSPVFVLFPQIAHGFEAHRCPSPPCIAVACFVLLFLCVCASEAAAREGDGFGVCEDGAELSAINHAYPSHTHSHDSVNHTAFALTTNLQRRGMQFRARTRSRFWNFAYKEDNTHLPCCSRSVLYGEGVRGDETHKRLASCLVITNQRQCRNDHFFGTFINVTPPTVPCSPRHAHTKRFAGNNRGS